MLCITNERMDPAFNLAAEEYLLKTVREPAFMLWRSRPAVVIGRNQNPYRQADIAFLERSDIPVIRRISGGGAVYLDPGTINFTFVRPTGGRRAIDYRTPLEPVVRFLRRMGWAAEFDGRNGLAVNGKKVSGNAQHVHQGMLLHHGTLLVDSDLHTLAAALRRADAGKYSDRSVDSMRRPVANLRSFANGHLSVDAVMQRLLAHVQSENGGRQVRLSAADQSAIERLADDRYRRWDWNFGRTPDYRFASTARLGQETVAIEMQVRGGTIRRIAFDGRGLNGGLAGEVACRLEGCRHHRQAVVAALEGVDGAGGVDEAGVARLAEDLF